MTTIHSITVVANSKTTGTSITRFPSTSEINPKAEGISGRPWGSGYGTKETPDHVVNHSVFGTVSAGTAVISMKIYVGIMHL